jgi:glycogen operon protein
MFSAGTPMLLGGDEFLRTQNGNNNAYCQDNPISWFDWDRVRLNQDMVAFSKKVMALTRQYPVLQSRVFLEGRDRDGNGVLDIAWFGTDGYAPQWGNSEARTLCYRLDGAEDQTPAGDYQLFIIFNADHQMQGVALPQLQGKRWFRLLDTSLPAGEEIAETGREVKLEPAGHYLANPRSTVVLLGRKA